MNNVNRKNVECRLVISVCQVQGDYNLIKEKKGLKNEKKKSV